MTSGRDRDRTDGVEVKLRLLAAAYAGGRRDVAMSLAESIRDTLRFERMTDGESGAAVHSTPDEFARVDDLPDAWAGWARGWSFVKTLGLFETVGLERAGEPVTIRLGIRADQATDLRRELRVARIEADSSLREVPCQVDGVTRDDRGWRCRLLVPADVPGHGRATYLVFFGNRFAERPDYVTDLRVQGEGYGLEITNHHYVARLSRQMGQLERLISRREHGLELYAGGKGHGEPPGIDWAHDYVDRGGFQKLRMRNWAACPNFEVESGPLAVRVPALGVPAQPGASPVHAESRPHGPDLYVPCRPALLPEGRPDRRDPGRGRRGDARRRVGLLGLLVHRDPLDRPGRQAARRPRTCRARPTTSGASAFAIATAGMRSWHSGWSTPPKGSTPSATTGRRPCTTPDMASSGAATRRSGPG